MLSNKFLFVTLQLALNGLLFIFQVSSVAPTRQFIDLFNISIYPPSFEKAGTSQTHVLKIGLGAWTNTFLEKLTSQDNFSSRSCFALAA